MNNQNIISQNAPPTNDERTTRFQYLDRLFSQLPDHAYDWLFSVEATRNVEALAKKFRLNDNQTEELARITGLVVLKDFPLANLTSELKTSLGLDETTARLLALDTAQTQFLALRDHLVEVVDFIRQLGGSLPAALPPLLKSTAASRGERSELYGTAPRAVPRGVSPTGETLYGGEQSELYGVAQKSLRQLVIDNKDALNQNLTSAPIKIADFNQPVRPTIKNWLVDYVKIKGAGHHEAIERGDYLFNNVNSRALPESERALVAAILKAYDDDSPLPISAADQTILLDKLVAPAAPRGDSPKGEELYGAAPRGGQTAPTNIPYREPVSPEDLAGPLKPPPPQRNAPRLSGNIIDLKDLE